MFPMQLSLGLPSNISIHEKEKLVKDLEKSNLGVFVSDLPSNHDLFQLMSVWNTKYPNIPVIGTAIISPLNYTPSFLIKQISTLFELEQSKFNIGLGVGDPKFLTQKRESPFSDFKSDIRTILSSLELKMNSNKILLAGSGDKMLKFANESNLGIIYNGIPQKVDIDFLTSKITLNNISAFTMVEFAEFNSLSKPFISIVSRILAGLKKAYMVRHNIKISEIVQIRKKVQENSFKDYHDWLPPSLVRKVAFYGPYTEFKELMIEMKKLKLNQLIVSLPDVKSRNTFIKESQKE